MTTQPSTKTTRSKLTAYMQLARLSNLPTVFSNVLVGVALVPWFPPFPWGDAGIAMSSVALLYIGGMAHNDLLDRKIDAVERPQRPIPSGAVSAREAAIFTLLCFAGGMLSIALFIPRATVPAMLLLAAIVCYNALHKRWGGAVIFMGLCRALVYLVAAESVGMERAPLYFIPVLFLGILLALYITLLTLVARKEAAGTLGARKWLTIVIAVVPGAIFIVRHPSHLEWTIPLGLLLLAWLLRSAWFVWKSPPRVVPAILGLLAGISLLDAFFLTFTIFPQLSLAALGCFAVTVWGHRRIAGT